MAVLPGREPGGLPLHPDAAGRLGRWVSGRLRERGGIALVGEADGVFGGFLLARVGEAEAVPPVVRGQRTAWIDAVAVVPGARRRGIGRRLVVAGLGKIGGRGVERIEASWEAGDPAAVGLWRSAGFEALLVHGWMRPGDPERS
jgi:ribosomal protein S18 acetylase RimI-like enzyme